MCFSIPVKVIDIDGCKVAIEGGKVARVDKTIHIHKGDYVQLTGDVVVGTLSKAEGLKVRRLIKRLNEDDHKS